MKMHDYLFDINYLTSLAREQYNGRVEDFSSQLDSFLSNQGELSPEIKDLVEMTFDFLKGILQDDENEYSDAFHKGYRIGQADCEC